MALNKQERKSESTIVTPAFDHRIEISRSFSQELEPNFTPFHLLTVETLFNTPTQCIQ